jgi:hypothetical protein
VIVTTSSKRKTKLTYLLAGSDRSGAQEKDGDWANLHDYECRENVLMISPCILVYGPIKEIVYPASLRNEVCPTARNFTGHFKPLVPVVCMVPECVLLSSPAQLLASRQTLVEKL